VGAGNAAAESSPAVATALESYRPVEHLRRGTLPRVDNRWLSVSAAVALAFAPACASRYSVPETRRAPERGLAPAGFDAAKACHDWRVAARDVQSGERDAALSHIAYPEAEANACFIPVQYVEGRALRPEVPAGCGYPEDEQLVSSKLKRQAHRFGAWDFEPAEVPFALDCSLDSRERARVSEINVNTLMALANELESLRLWTRLA
jgi:hypothetical protein